MGGPAVSVVTASFNHARFSKVRIESILGQTFEHFEWIVVDDCSTDGSDRIYESLSRSDRRVRFISNSRNLGMGASTNLAISVARAPYVVRAESDDSCHPDFLCHLYSAIQTHETVAVAFGMTRKLDAEGVVSGGLAQGSRRKFLSSEEALKRLARTNFIGGPSAIVRRSVFDDVGPFAVLPFVVACDWHFYLRCAASGHAFVYEPAAVSYHRSHGENLSGLVGREPDASLLVTESLRLVNDAISESRLSHSERRRVRTRVSIRFLGAHAARMKRSHPREYQELRDLSATVDPRWKSPAYVAAVEILGTLTAALRSAVLQVVRAIQKQF